MKREDIILEALSWEGTKYQHQQSLKGVACDCVGLIRGVHQNISKKPIGDDVYDYAATWHLYKSEEKLYNECKKYLDEILITEIKHGDILLFGFGKGPAHHMGIYLGGNKFIHSWAEVDRVSITNLNSVWRNRIRAAFQMREVE